jgi:hypothetical protein
VVSITKFFVTILGVGKLMKRGMTKEKTVMGRTPSWMRGLQCIHVPRRNRIPRGHLASSTPNVEMEGPLSRQKDRQNAAVKENLNLGLKVVRGTLLVTSLR